MRKRLSIWPVLIGLLLLALVLQACGGFPPVLFYSDSAQAPAAVATQPKAAAPTSPPVEEPTAVPTEEPTAVPTEEPTAAPTEAPTATPTEASTATPVPPTATSVPPTATPVQPTATPLPPTATPVPKAVAPAWPAEIVLTEADVEDLAAGSPVQGLTIDGLQVTFEDGSMTMSADNIRYGFLSIKDLTIKGHVTVSNGTVTFHADSITPRNLATAAIPGLIDQSLNSALAEWYVEDVRIEPGQMVVLVRPRE